MRSSSESVLKTLSTHLLFCFKKRGVTFGAISFETAGALFACSKRKLDKKTKAPTIAKKNNLRIKKKKP